MGWSASIWSIQKKAVPLHSFSAKPEQKRMTITLQQQWAQCQTILADNLTSSAYQTWFAPIVPLQFAEGVLVLQVKSQFVAVRVWNTAC